MNQSAPPTASGPLLRFENVSRKFADVVAVGSTDCVIATGSLVALVGHRVRANPPCSK